MRSEIVGYNDSVRRGIKERKIRYDFRIRVMIAFEVNDRLLPEYTYRSDLFQGSKVLVVPVSLPVCLT